MPRKQTLRARATQSVRSHPVTWGAIIAGVSFLIPVCGAIYGVAVWMDGHYQTRLDADARFNEVVWRAATSLG